MPISDGLRIERSKRRLVGVEEKRRPKSIKKNVSGGEAPIRGGTKVLAYEKKEDSYNSNTCWRGERSNEGGKREEKSTQRSKTLIRLTSLAC